NRVTSGAGFVLPEGADLALSSDDSAGPVDEIDIVFIAARSDVRSENGKRCTMSPDDSAYAASCCIGRRYGRIDPCRVRDHAIRMYSGHPRSSI
ncbi:hypothetical protein, partial [Paracraurococcus lichenis]